MKQIIVDLGSAWKSAADRRPASVNCLRRDVHAQSGAKTVKAIVRSERPKAIRTRVHQPVMRPSRSGFKEPRDIAFALIMSTRAGSTGAGSRGGVTRLFPGKGHSVTSVFVTGHPDASEIAESGSALCYGFPFLFPRMRPSFRASRRSVIQMLQLCAATRRGMIAPGFSAVGART
jgi:hypothetical protein